MAVNTTTERIVYEGEDKLSAASKKAYQGVQNLRGALDGVSRVMGVLGISAGAGALVSIAINSIKATAALDDMAEATGASVEGLSAIQRVAKIGGHDFEGLTGTISKMVKGLKEGGDEGTKAQHALAMLGVKAREADGSFRDTSQILVDVAQKLGQYKDGGDKLALVQDILGKGAERYLPLLKDMAKDGTLQATTTTKQAEEAEKLQKNINRLTIAFDDYARVVANAAVPVMVSFTDKLVQANEKGGIYLATLRTIAAVTGKMGGPLGTLGHLGGLALDAQQSAKPPASQADVRRIDNEILPGKKLAYTSPADLAAINRERAKLLEEDARNWVRHADEVLATEERRLLELARITEKQYADADQARLEQIDREQEFAIERGEATLEADGPSHTMRLIALRQAFGDEEMLEAERHAKKLETLKLFSDEELAELGGRQALEQQMEMEHWDRVQQIRTAAITTLEQFSRASWQRQAAHMSGMIMQMTAGLASGSRTMFEINRAASLANIAVTGPDAVMNAYRWGSAWGGPPGGAAMALLAAAVVREQVSQVLGAKFGGGGGSAPSNIGTPGVPVTQVPAAPAAPAGPTTIIQLRGGGSRFTEAEVLGLLEQIAETTRDGGKVVIAD